jgi:hypothetical protein
LFPGLKKLLNKLIIFVFISSFKKNNKKEDLTKKRYKRPLPELPEKEEREREK